MTRSHFRYIALTCILAVSFTAVNAQAQSFTVTMAATGNGSVQSNPAGITCPGTCAFDFPSGSNVTLTATPSAGNILVGWLGCDTAFGLTCSISALAAPRTITATFTPSATTVPTAPTPGVTNNGNGQGTIHFIPPTNTGGTPISNYTATCTPGPFTAFALASPITVRGLANGTSYACTVTATNAAGTGPASGPVVVAPSAVPLALISVQSRKTHGGFGTYDVPINATVGLAGSVSIEPRERDTGHSLIFEFNGPVSATGSVNAVDSIGATVAATIGSSSVRQPGSGTVGTLCCGVNVLLPDVADNKRVSVSLSGVNGVLNASASIGFLVGDVNSTRAVTAADVASVKARTSQAATTANFRNDFNASGMVDAADVTTVKTRTGQALPEVPGAPTITHCYAQSGKAFITGTNFVSGSTSVTLNSLAASVVSGTTTTVIADLPPSTPAGNVPVSVTVAGTPSVASGTCSVSLSPPITFSVEGNQIPAFSKFANIPGAVHAGLNGANGQPGYYRQNAWAVTPAGICLNTASPITRIWYHNLDYSGYVGGSAGSEFFGIQANEALVYSFIAPPDGTRGSMQLNESTAATLVASFVSISSQPCDFDVTKANNLSGCYNARNGPSTTSYFSTTGSGGLFECKLTPGQRYYLNYRSQDVSAAPNGDSCQSAGAGWCGGLFTLR